MAEPTNWSLGAGLEGQGVLVTGAAQGVGQATAQAMAAVGARVAAVDRNLEGVRETVAQLDDPERHQAVGFDLTDISALPEMVSSVTTDFGGLWAVVNAAAVLRRQPLHEVTEADWDFQLDANLKAGFFLNRAAGEVMIKGGQGGRIINFSSMAWLLGPLSGSDTYVASKAGVVSMTRGFARHYGPHGILVNTVAPGQIDTPMQHIDIPAELVVEAAAKCPLGRMGQPQELAAVAVFLASRHASFINGATINVSGGLVMY